MHIRKILFVGNTAWSMYNFRRSLFSKLLTLNYDVTVVSPEDEFYQNKLKELGCNCITLDIASKGVNPFIDGKLILNIKKILVEVKPDFCFFYTIKPNIYGSIAANSLNINHIAIITGLGYTFINNNIISIVAKKLYKFALKSASQIWFLNSEDKEIFIKYKLVDKSKTSILKGEGIDLNHFCCTDLPKKTSFLLIARMLWDKGVGEFVDAAKLLKSKYPDVNFNLLGFVGVDNPSAISNKQIDEWTSSGVINYLGSTTDVRPYISECSCVVLPSYREGVPVSLLEGAAMGRPLITTNAVGCKEAVDHGINGYICNIKDVNGLAKCMEQIILMSPDERLNMGLKGRKKMEREFDVNLVINRYIDVLV